MSDEGASFVDDYGRNTEQYKMGEILNLIGIAEDVTKDVVRQNVELYPPGTQEDRWTHVTKDPTIAHAAANLHLAYGYWLVNLPLALTEIRRAGWDVIRSVELEGLRSSARVVKLAVEHRAREIAREKAGQDGG